MSEFKNHCWNSHIEEQQYSPSGVSEHNLNLSSSLSSPVSLHSTLPPLPYKRGLTSNSNLTYTKPFPFYSGYNATPWTGSQACQNFKWYLPVKTTWRAAGSQIWSISFKVFDQNSETILMEKTTLRARTSNRQIFGLFTLDPKKTDRTNFFETGRLEPVVTFFELTKESFDLWIFLKTNYSEICISTVQVKI